MRQLKITSSITNRDTQSLDQYLNDISKIGMVSPDEEVILTRLIRAGDVVALHKLTQANLRFVVSVSKKFQNQGLPLIDLISEGNLGLIKAAQRFDETKGFKFISYAVWWIRQSIMMAIAEQSRIVRLPINQLGNLTKVYRAASDLEQQLGREPSVEELADLMDKPIENVAEIMSKSGRALSLDAPIGDDQNTLMDLLASNSKSTDDALLKESITTLLTQALKSLPERERTVLILFFGIGLPESHTLEDIGRKFGITRERVRQMKENALRHLRRYAATNNMLKLLEE